MNGTLCAVGGEERSPYYGPVAGSQQHYGANVADYSQMCQSVAEQTCVVDAGAWCTPNCCHNFNKCCENVCFYLRPTSTYRQQNCATLYNGRTGLLDPSQTFCVCAATRTLFYPCLLLLMCAVYYCRQS
jgi:hypothetical protein